ncbi:MAG: response regulator [Deltaproteobacteria bacterium]|nr:response regulator [Deltaproteobacteria bacterium]
MVVLVVEDEPLLRASMVRGLSKLHGLEVVDASSVSDATELIRTMRPEMIVSDLHLQDGLGTEILTTLDACGLRIPVLFTSAYLDELRGHIPVQSNIEVREKPLSMEALRAIVQERVEIGMSISREAPFALTDYIQLACMGRHSVNLTVQQGNKRLGEIVVAKGEIWSANDEQGAGLEAFHRIVGKAAGSDGVRTRCEQASGDVAPRSIEGDWQGLMFDAVRIWDEDSRDVEAIIPDVAEMSGDASEPLLVLDEAAGALQGPQDVQHVQHVQAAQAQDVDTAPRTRGGLSAGDTWTTSAGRATRDLLSGSPAKPVLGVDEARTLFASLRDEGVDALLRKDYATAYEAFAAAQGLDPEDRSVAANIDRLREMGFGVS